MRAIFHSIKKTGNVMYKFSTTNKTLEFTKQAKIKRDLTLMEMQYTDL